MVESTEKDYTSPLNPNDLVNGGFYYAVEEKDNFKMLFQFDRIKESMIYYYYCIYGSVDNIKEATSVLNDDWLSVEGRKVDHATPEQIEILKQKIKEQKRGS